MDKSELRIVFGVVCVMLILLGFAAAEAFDGVL